MRDIAGCLGADMTGGYVDSNDLDKLLKSPTKKTARECLKSQIQYWFQVGPTSCDMRYKNWSLDGLNNDKRIQDIAERHGLTYCLPLSDLQYV